MENLPKMSTAGTNLVNELDKFAQSGNTNPAIDKKVIPESSPGQTIKDNDFLNTGSHTKTEQGNATNPANPANATGTTPATAPAKTSNVLGNSGKLAVTLIHEIVIPALVVWVCSMFKKHVDKESLKLSKEDKEVLTPAWQDYLNSVNISFDKPIYQLLLAIGFTYGSKFMDGSIKITEMKAVSISKTDAITKAPDKVTEENYKDVFDIEREALIGETMKVKRQKREKIIAFLQQSGALKRLDKALRKKYNLSIAA